jgi:hypothetical protein
MGSTEGSFQRPDESQPAMDSVGREQKDKTRSQNLFPVAVDKGADRMFRLPL